MNKRHATKIFRDILVKFIIIFDMISGHIMCVLYLLLLISYIFIHENALENVVCNWWSFCLEGDELNQISLMHGSKIKYVKFCCLQFYSYSYKILCHEGWTSPPTSHKISWRYGQNCNQQIFHSILMSLRPGDPNIQHWKESPSVQVMACHLLGAKPLPEPMLPYD